MQLPESGVALFPTIFQGAEGDRDPRPAERAPLPALHSRRFATCPKATRPPHQAHLSFLKEFRIIYFRQGLYLRAGSDTKIRLN